MFLRFQKDFKGAVICTLCSGGKYSGEGASHCSDCGQGSFSSTGATLCEMCDNTKGFVSKGVANDACEYCGVGKYAELATHECKSCIRGKYSVGGVSECLVCEEGKFSDNEGASSCSTAEAGKRIVKEGVLRIGEADCEKETFSTGAKDDCAVCEGGGHSEAGSSSCVKSPPGFYYDGTSDQPCVAGKFAAAGASTEAGCLECVNGKYSSPGAAYCSTAEAGKRVTKVGGLRVNVTACLLNTFSTGADDNCADCEGGHSEPGSSSCIETPQGHFFDGSADLPYLACHLETSLNVLVFVLNLLDLKPFHRPRLLKP